MAKPDFQEMLDTALPFVKRMLAECGDFIPFGIRLPIAGKAEFMNADVGVEHPRSADVMLLLESTLKNEAEHGQIRGGAICFMGRVTRPGESTPVDVATFRMAHVSGEMLDVFLPYGISGDDHVTYSALFAAKGASFGLTRQQQS